jgi:hypothetical protein
MLLPLFFAALLLALAYPIQDQTLQRAFAGAGSVLAAWALWLFFAAKKAGRSLTLAVVLRKPHYVQMCAQGALWLYWGWHVPFIYGFAPLVLAQLLFAYGISTLLTWSRRDVYELGFGPVPITLSINFFLVFKPEWFHWQFLIIALGYFAKDFIRWTREGRSAHIFNPSSFPLSVFSLVLILTGSTELTFGVEFATTLFNPPNIYLVIFLVSLPGQLLFGVTTMTVSAVVTAYLAGLAFYGATGTYLFYDAYIPIAVFLGMHLLFTDPATSPRSESGRIVFGVLYGLLIIAMYGLLRLSETPTFYDKLLPIPICNMLVLLIERAVGSKPLRVLDLSWIGRGLTTAQRRVATVGLWALIFATISGSGGLGDDHRGQYLPFWQETCAAGSDRACDYVVAMQENFCERGSGWACNELGIELVRRSLSDAGQAAVKRGCDLGHPAGCENVRRLATGMTTLASQGPLLEDLPIVIRGSKGPIRETDPTVLLSMACERGWPGTCSGTTAMMESLH